jgi:predicted nucleic acid-binding protein
VPLVLETEAVLKRPEQIEASRGTVRENETLLIALIAVARPVYRSFFWRPPLRDADDDMVLETALNGHADLLVTFNLRDFEPAASDLRISVVAPRVALNQIKEEK